MKLLSIIIFCSLTAGAGTITNGPSTCVPNFQVDDQPVPIGCPNLGAAILAKPGVAFVAINDNDASQGTNANGGYSTGDYNDGSATLFLILDGVMVDLYGEWGGGLSSVKDGISVGNVVFDEENEGNILFAGKFAIDSVINIDAIIPSGRIQCSYSNACWEGQIVSIPRTSTTPEPPPGAAIGFIALLYGTLALIKWQRDKRHAIAE